MAFWQQGNTKTSSAPAVGGHARQPHPGPARPLTYLLSTGPASLTDSTAALVRLRIDVPSAAGLFATAHAADDDEDDEEAAQQTDNLACAIGQLHQAARGIEQSSDLAKTSALLEVLQDQTLQLLCNKAVVAKVYKSLLPHQAAAGYSMAPAKSCLSQKPVAAWDLEETLQTAVIKTLTGCSSGTAAHHNNNSNSTTITSPAASAQDSLTTTAAAAAAQPVWMGLSRHKLVGSNLLAAIPGVVSTAPFVEMEAKYDAGGKGLLLLVHAAGSIKFRRFSPMQALQQEPKSLKAPLSLADSDAGLLADPSKLAAAARQLEGRAVKLLPDERLAFVKSITATPTDTAELQRTAQYWLGAYGLLLPPTYPFLLGVASHPEAEAAQLQVPSCCVLTNLGLSVLPGSAVGGSCHQAAVSRLVTDLQDAAGAYSFWGNRLAVELREGGQSGLSQANLQVNNKQISQPLGGASTTEAAAAAQPKAYSLSTQWTPASELSKLQQQANSKPADPRPQQQQQQQQQLTAAQAQLMGLMEADEVTWCDTTAAAGSQHGARQQQQQLTAGSSAPANNERWQGLKAFLSDRESEEQQAKHAVAAAVKTRQGTGLGQGGGVAAAAAAHGNSSSTNAMGSASASNRTAAAALGGAPAAPRFGSRRPGASKPPAAPKAGSRKPAGAAAKAAGGATAVGGGVGGNSRLLAALQAGQLMGSDAAGGAAGGAGGTVGAGTGAPAVAKAVTLGKRPGAADTVGKPPGPKKVKAAAAAGAATAKPKAAPKKAAKAPAAAAAGGGASVASAAAGPVVAVDDAAGQPSTAAPEQQQRKRTKASDLGLSAVSSKIQAAHAASGGTCLKGVSVPEMQCYLRAQGVKGGSAKRADVEARLLALLAGSAAPAGN